MKPLQRLCISLLFFFVWETSFQGFPVEAKLRFHGNEHAKLRSIFSDNQFVYNFFKHLLEDDGRIVSMEVTPRSLIDSRRLDVWNSSSPETGGRSHSIPSNSVLSTALTTSPSTTPRSYYCSSPSIPSDGVIIPEGDQTWAVGSVQSVTCLVNPESGITSQDISISLGFNQPPLPHQVIDNYTIMATLNATEPGSYKLLCTSSASGESKLLCMRSVKVGYAPLDVKNLKCVSWNWSVLECNWTIPSNPAQAPSEDYLVHLVTDVNKSSPCDEFPEGCLENCCKWTVPSYSQSSVYYTIRFSVENQLGSDVFDHIFKNTDTVIPNAAENINLKTTDGSLDVRVEWTLPVYIGVLAEQIGIHCAVEYRPSSQLYGNETWMLGRLTICRQKECNATVKVEHPGAIYEFRVRLRARQENFTLEEDGWWSKWTSVDKDIPSQRPWKPPALDVGTFQSKTGIEVGRRDLTVAWRPLLLLEHNGPDLAYVVNATADGWEISYSTISDTFVTFNNISDDSLLSLEVTAANRMGVCNYTSHMEVFPTYSMPPLPVLPVVIFHENTQQYELTWNNKESANNSFTVYICTGGQGSKEACKDNLYWIAVGNVTSVNVTLRDFNLNDLTNKNLRFALSGETAAGGISSGMSWDDCLSPQPYKLSSSPPVIGDSISRYTTSANITWTLDCEYRGAVVEAIIVELCIGFRNLTKPCESPEFLTQTDVFSGQVRLTDLEPGSIYTVRLRLQYREGLSIWSDHKEFITDKIPKVGMPTWLILVISLACIVMAVFLVLCFTYSKGKVKEVIKDLNRDLNVPIGMHPGVRQNFQGEGTAENEPSLFPRKHSYENFHSRDSINKDTPASETQQSTSTTSSNTPSPKGISGGRSIAAGGDIQQRSEEEETLLQRDSESGTINAFVTNAPDNLLQNPSNTPYVTYDISFENANKSLGNSESIPQSNSLALPPRGYVALQHPDLFLMSNSGYSALHGTDIVHKGYSTVKGNDFKETHELPVYKSLPIAAEIGRSIGHVSSDNLNALNALSPCQKGYVQIDHLQTDQSSQLHQAGPTSYASIGSLTPVEDGIQILDERSDKRTENTPKSGTKSNHNKFTMETNGYVEHPFRGSDYNIDCGMLPKEDKSNPIASGRNPGYVEHPFTWNEYDANCSQLMNEIVVKEGSSDSATSARKHGYVQHPYTENEYDKESEQLKNAIVSKHGRPVTAELERTPEHVPHPFAKYDYDKNYEKPNKAILLAEDEHEIVAPLKRKPSLGYVVAESFSNSKQNFGFIENPDHDGLFGQNNASGNSYSYQANNMPQKTGSSGYVMDQNVKHIFEYDIHNSSQPVSLLSLQTLRDSKDKSGYSALPEEFTGNSAAGSPDSGVSSLENLPRLCVYEKAKSDPDGNDEGSEMNDLRRWSVVSNDLPPSYCRVGDGQV